MRQQKPITPFWTAYALTLTETVGAGILALPIAVAGVGPTPGIAVIVVLGCINMATIAAIAESATHNSRMRSGSGYFGELVHDLLGTFGSVTTSFALAILCFSALVAYYIGFSMTLANATGIGEPFWVTALFCFGAYLISRPTLEATVGFAVTVSAVN